MLPGMDFKRLRYDEEGTMEKLVAGLELERRIATETNQPYKTLKDLFECDSEGKLLGSNLISDIKNLIGLLLVNLVSVINPQVIILGGGIGKQLALRYTDYFEEFLSAHVPYVPLIVPTILDEKANLLGAVAYALSFIHKDYSSLNIMENSLGYN
jgi:predicted NBD/HSP70 family sugar kinase